MPTDTILKLKQRDFKTLKRFNTAYAQSILLKSFFEKGFKSYDALKAIVLNYYPEISENRLWDFWHFRILDEEISEKLTDVFEKLKSE
ncbi:hypothetical protein [Flavobacterium aquiphilum]|uniref:hypothetical protein n=1 Tax=Flavobacterium aquiphilum TaxID=3003261 RepID=UPI002480858A|nr:hypothetical protein [Flavobacterium aquiphilum]